MNTIPREKVYERYYAAPEAIQKLAGSETLNDFLMALIEKNRLTTDQGRALGNLVNYTLLGFIHPPKLTDALKIEMDLPGEKCDQIFQEIDKKILMPVKDILPDQGGSFLVETQNASLKKIPLGERAHNVEEGVLNNSTTTSAAELQQQNRSANKSLIDHLQDFEERKKRKKEEAAQQQKEQSPSASEVPAKATASQIPETTATQKKVAPPENLPTASEDVLGEYVERGERKKAYPSDKDPYREPIE